MSEELRVVTPETYGPVGIREFSEHWKLVQDIPYYEHPEAGYQEERCKLDVWYPNDRKNVPTLIYFHGGGITGGDKSEIVEVYKLLGCVIISANYRLSPRAKCPDYLYDAASAVAWAKRNAEKYNGSSSNIFVTGQSAGAYLSAVLCTMPKYLAKFGLKPEDFSGYMPISGEMITHFTIRAERGIPATEQVVDEYAPLAYVRPDLPPFMMLTGQTGLEIDCRPGDNKLMRDALLFCGNKTAEYYEMPNLTHGTVWPAAYPYMLDFIRKYLH